MREGFILNNKTLNLLREFSIPLISGVIVALMWANLGPQSYYDFVHTKFIGNIDFHFLINDIFMVFFFAIAAVEITQSVLPGGDLNPIRKAINPLFATAGGVLGPIALFFIFNALIGLPDYTRGWGIPTATDIALAWLVARMIFGKGHPAVSFLLLLAIADDAIGLGIIAIFYPDPNHPTQPLYLLLTLGGMIIAYVLRRMGTHSYWPYLLVGGLLSWFGLFKTGLHPALALVFIIPFLPHAKREEGHLFDTTEHEHSTLTQFEHEWKAFVDLGLFAFGLSNAGVEFASISNVTWIVLTSLIIGKTFGIFIMGYIAQLIGFPLPDGMSNKELIVAGLIAGLGLTVALFVAGVAFTDPTIQGAAKMGALLSGLVFILAPIASKVFGIKKGKNPSEG